MKAGLPLRPLAMLTAAVLAAHWLALLAAPGRIQLAPPAASPSFVTRSVQAPPPAAATPAAPEEKTAVARTQSGPVAPESIAKAAPAQVQPTPTPESVAAASAPAPAPAPQAEPATPPAAAPVPALAVAEAPAQGAPLLRERGVRAASFAIPGPARLRYQVLAHARGGDWHARAELLWRHDGSSYDARLELSVPFLPSRIQRSAGRITAEGLAPTRFSDKARSEEAAHFERERGVVVFSNNRPEAPLLAGAQDRLSVLLQLAAMIAGEPAKYPAATTITVQTASTREADQWLFTVEGEEELQLPGGTVRALKLIRNPRKEFDQKVELWLAPDMDYVPVRVRLTQANGDWLDQQWSGTDRG